MSGRHEVGQSDAREARACRRRPRFVPSSRGWTWPSYCIASALTDTAAKSSILSGATPTADRPSPEDLVSDMPVKAAAHDRAEEDEASPGQIECPKTSEEKSDREQVSCALRR
jgi:hypothetical protein